MPITTSHPVPDLLSEARELSRMFDLARYNTGLRALDLAAQGVLDCFQNEADPDGVPWPPLDPSYEGWKTATVGSKPIGYLFGVMSDMAQIQGISVITADQATMTYGITEEAKIEATKFQEGGAVTGTNQPPRPFYGFSFVGVYMVNTMFDDHFTQFMT